MKHEQDDAQPGDADMRNSPGLPTGYQVTLTPDSYKKMKNRRTPIKPQSQKPEDNTSFLDYQSIANNLKVANKRSHRTLREENIFNSYYGSPIKSTKVVQNGVEQDANQMQPFND